MADLDFTHRVQEIPAGAQLPESRRTVTAEVTKGPNVQAAVSQYAQDTNWMSALGSEVATRASTELAARLGSEVGTNPHGDIGPSLTEFDKAFEKSYVTQAQSTLGLQAQKLITKSNLELASAPRLNAGMIANAQKQVDVGLNKIYAMAPSSVRPQMELQYGGIRNTQVAQLTDRMLREQKEDRQNTTISSINVINQNAYSMALNGVALDADGNSLPAYSAIKTTERLTQAAVDMREMKPQEARVAVDSVRQSYLSGKYSRKALIADKDKKLPEFYKSLAENPPSDLNENDRLIVLKNVFDYMNYQTALRRQDQQLLMTQMDVKLAINPDSITGVDLARMKEDLSPVQFEQVHLKSINAIKKRSTENQGANLITSGFTNAEIMARGTTAQKNIAFDRLVTAHMQKMQTKGTPIGLDEAESQIAAAAAGVFPNYINVLNEKLKSTNPVDLESAGKSISYIFQSQKGANLTGLNPQAVAMYGLYKTLRRSRIPQEAAVEAYNSVYQQSLEDQNLVSISLTDQLNSIKRDTGKLTFFTDLAGIDVSNLIDPLGFQEQAESIFRSNYALTKGDLETAKTMTADTIKNTYGESYVNGRKETTFYPLENVVGIPSDGVGYIQDDVIEFVTQQVESTKKAFNDGSIPYYWEVEPRRSLENVKNQKEGSRLVGMNFETPELLAKRKSLNLEEFEQGSEMKIYKHWRNGTRETFPLIIKADPWLAKSPNPTKPYTAGWDIVLGTENGVSPLFRENPMMGQYIVYKPNIEKIRARYLSEHNTLEYSALAAAHSLIG